ncbi:hypothetical protein FRC09_000603 [Ceratobasidium sp. 395]|nr:hypothetical protein FRC09_000603 [Ceratobasidium sp. 395]
MYTWSKAEDPNVLKLLGVARFQDQLAMVSPWMSNGDIMAYLAKHPQADRCELDNVMICEDGTTKLADFGSAKLKDYTLQFSENLIPRSGTTKFLAPERLRGEGPSAEADVYALGMTILHVISGEPPFKETDRDAMYMTVTRFKIVPARPQESIPDDSEHGDILWSLLLHCWDQQAAARPGAIAVHESMKDITPNGLRPNSLEDSSAMPWHDDDEMLPVLDASDITDRLVPSQCSSQPSFSGHMTEVYRGKLDDGSEVAIKCVISTSTQSQNSMKHAAREMYAWSKIQHKHVLEFLGAALYRNQFAMVSPWMANGNLSQYFSKNPDADRYMMCVQMSEGLAYLHQNGIVHGNFTADNVLVSEDGEAKIADFGSTRLDAYSIVITSESQIGDCKMSWTAPELLSTQGCAKNFKTDIYSFGMTMFQVISTKDATMQNDITALIHMTPSQRRVSPLEEAGITQSEHGGMLWALLDKCWGSDPETRPDATALQIQLGAIFRRRTERPPSPTINSANELPNTGVVSYIIERGCPDLSKLLALPLVEERPFAHGGFGDVYRGVLKDNQQVAIKCFRSRLGMTEQAHTDRGALKAPEILTGEGRRSTKSDIYALGMTILEIVTGGVPFKGMSDIGVVREVAIRRGIPKRPYEKIHGEGGDILWEILLGCWTFDPNRRTTASQIVVSVS